MRPAPSHVKLVATLHEGSDLSDRAVELVDQAGVEPVDRAVDVEKGSVVPERAVPTADDPIEHLDTVRAQVHQDQARVVELVGDRDQERVRRDPAEAGDVALLPLPPRQLRLLGDVRAREHDRRDVLPEPLADAVETRQAPWSSTASCRSAGIACVSVPPSSITSEATPRMCEAYGISLPLRTCVR